MSGVRIHAVDMSLAGATVVLPHPFRTLPGGQPKRYMFRLDDQASAIVSPVVWDRLLEVMAHAPGAPTFWAANEVRQPPALTIGGKAETRPTVELAEGKLIRSTVTTHVTGR